jgi:hypothetical protein
MVVFFFVIIFWGGCLVFGLILLEDAVLSGDLDWTVDVRGWGVYESL